MRVIVAFLFSRRQKIKKQGRRNPLILLVAIFLTSCFSAEQNPIKVGILHSLTGTMAISEKSVVDATLMAIDEINEKGGLLGRQIVPVVVDGRSDWPTFAREAERLNSEEKVSAIFGGWTSASRKMMKPIVEKHGHLLFYPIQYEGLEESPNIVYTGAAPNQQITPAVKWAKQNLGQRFYLVASDYVFPRAANKLIKAQLSALGATLVGEYYLPLGSQIVGPMITDIEASRPDVILNTINGDSNIAFFRELAAKKIEAPTISFSIAEDELLSMNSDDMVGHYSAWSYFQSFESAQNSSFVKRFKKAYGEDRTTNASMEAGYIGVHLWAKSVTQAGDESPPAVLQIIRGQRYNAPEGLVTVSSINNHLWKPLRIGQVEGNGQFKIVWSEVIPIRPHPFPTYKAKLFWESYLNRLYEGWGNNWAAPSKPEGVE